jgi:L-rhamnose mutarotase
VERVCFTMQVVPEKLEEYLERHRAVWPEMLEALYSTGWRNYSLFARPDGLIVAYLETEDFEAARENMGLTEIDAAWQESMAPLFAAGGSFEDGPGPLHEAFHLEDQLARARGVGQDR